VGNDEDEANKGTPTNPTSVGTSRVGAIMQHKGTTPSATTNLPHHHHHHNTIRQIKVAG